MANFIKKVRIRKQDGTYTDYIPIGADAKNIEMKNKKTLEETVGTIDVDLEGSISDQLAELKREIEELKNK